MRKKRRETIKDELADKSSFVSGNTCFVVTHTETYEDATFYRIRVVNGQSWNVKVESCEYLNGDSYYLYPSGNSYL